MGIDPVWENESDFEAFDHMGLRCVIVRNPHFGHLCGYVGIDHDHPFFGMGYDDQVKCKNSGDLEVNINEVGIMNIFCAAYNCDIENDMISLSLLLKVHGGLTYYGGPGKYPEEGNRWWFGFDCNHCDDLAPKTLELDRQYGFNTRGEYRTFDYVREQVKKLAEQLYLAQEMPEN